MHTCYHRDAAAGNIVPKARTNGNAAAWHCVALPDTVDCFVHGVSITAEAKLCEQSSRTGGIRLTPMGGETVYVHVCDMAARTVGLDGLVVLTMRLDLVYIKGDI